MARSHLSSEVVSELEQAAHIAANMLVSELFHVTQLKHHKYTLLKQKENNWKNQTDPSNTLPLPTLAPTHVPKKTPLQPTPTPSSIKKTKKKRSRSDSDSEGDSSSDSSSSSSSSSSSDGSSSSDSSSSSSSDSENEQESGRRSYFMWKPPQRAALLRVRLTHSFSAFYTTYLHAALCKGQLIEAREEDKQRWQDAEDYFNQLGIHVDLKTIKSQLGWMLYEYRKYRRGVGRYGEASYKPSDWVSIIKLFFDTLPFPMTDTEDITLPSKETLMQHWEKLKDTVIDFGPLKPSDKNTNKKSQRNAKKKERKAKAKDDAKNGTNTETPLNTAEVQTNTAQPS